MRNLPGAYNRVIIVGNGFDRALGLETDYPSFLLFYIKYATKKTFRQNQSGKELFTLRRQVYSAESIIEHVENATTIERAIDLLKQYANYSPNFFMSALTEHHKNKRWVDIEQLYYDLLIKNQTFKDEVKILNQSMDELATALNDYIAEQEENITSDTFEKFSSFTKSLVKKLPLHVISNYFNHIAGQEPENILVINFNYTNTIYNLLNSPYGRIYGTRQDVNIHGSVNDKNNPIIFGYGDDIDSNYPGLEAQNDNELLRMIKSFKYNRNQNYINILSFIENAKFEIFIVGHSCGLSDRTLLKTLFEHKHCCAIQSYHFNGKPEFFNRTIDISRHFENKILMRERLLSFDPAATIPQNKR